MPSTDTPWFQQKLAEKNLSQRAFAKLLDMPVSSVNKIVGGLQKLSVDQVGPFAVQLGVSPIEIIRRCGGEVPGVSHVPISGTIDAQGVVTVVPTTRHVDSPELAHGTRGLWVSDPNAVNSGWVYFYQPARAIMSEALGRISVVTLDDGRTLVGFLTRGFVEGTYTVRPLVGAAAEDVKPTTAAPVKWIRT